MQNSRLILDDFATHTVVEMEMETSTNKNPFLMSSIFVCDFCYRNPRNIFSFIFCVRQIKGKIHKDDNRTFVSTAAIKLSHQKSNLTETKTKP